MQDSTQRRFDHKVAFLPEPRPDAVNAEWLDWLKGLGYTGIYLEPDPGGPCRSGNSHQFQTLFRLISLYDLAWGQERARLRDWIGRCCHLAHERDMKVYLSLWEPRIPSEAWAKFPIECHGRGGFDRPPRNAISWCLSQPDAADAFQHMATEAFRNVPAIDGLKMGTLDNDAHLCDPSECERCAGLRRPEQFRRLFDRLVSAVDAAGLHEEEFDYVLYTWWWPRDAVEKVAPLFHDRKVTVLGRSTQGLPQHWKGRKLGTVPDIALGIDGIADPFKEGLDDAHERGWAMADMTGFGHTIEYFWLPYTPAPHRVADRIHRLHQSGASGWFDYDCGGIYPGINSEIIRQDHRNPGRPPNELVSQTLHRLYPAHEQEHALEAYRKAEEALAARPIGYQPPDAPRGAAAGVIEAVIALPFEPGYIQGFDMGHRIFYFQPANFMRPDALPTLLEMYGACTESWRKAWELFRDLEGQGDWTTEVLPWEKRIVRAHSLCAASAHRYIRMAHNRLARGHGELDARTERERLVTIFEEELADAEEFAELRRADRRLLMNVNIRLNEFLRRCHPWGRIDPDDPFKTKLRHTRDMLQRIQSEEWLDAVPQWNSDAQ
jgi:hypothetical protein